MKPTELAFYLVLFCTDFWNVFVFFVVKLNHFTVNISLGFI